MIATPPNLGGAISAATLVRLPRRLLGVVFRLPRLPVLQSRAGRRDGRLLGDKVKATIYAPYTTSVFLLGWAVGGLIFGALGDRYGRARILTITVLIYSVFTGLGAFSTSFFDFCVYDFCTGCGVGRLLRPGRACCRMMG
jgi:MFS family permease